jgi:hypothetical protein
MFYVPRLSELCGFDDIRDFQKAHREWVEAGSSRDTAGRDDRWSESIAVGSEGFVEQVKMHWASERNIARLPWRTICILFESRCRLMAIISIGKMRL